MDTKNTREELWSGEMTVDLDQCQKSFRKYPEPETDRKRDGKKLFRGISYIYGQVSGSEGKDYCLCVLVCAS